MKRISTILLFLLFATTLNAQELVSTDPVNRNIVLEEYTGVHCGWCPVGHKIANELATRYKDELFVINIHAGGFADDTQYDFRTEDGNVIYQGSNVSGFPSGNVNRLSESAIGRDIWGSYVENIIKEMAECNVAGWVVLDKEARKATITVEVYYTANSASANNYINVMMLQNNIIAYQGGSSQNPDQVVNGQYRHMHAFRDAITPAWGEEIAPTTKGTFITKTYEYDIPAKIGSFDVNIDDLEFVAFVTEKYQGKATRPILNANKLHNIYSYNEDVHPSILSVKESSAFSCSDNKTLKVFMANEGIAPLTSLKLEVSVDNGETETKTWEGNAVSEQIFNIELDVNVPKGKHDVNVKVVEANGVKYEDTETISVENGGWSEYKTNADEAEMTIELMQDKYGTQITWELLASDNTILASGGPYENISGISPTQLHEIKVKVPMGECVKFVIKDSKSNGICCQFGDGYYRILNSKGKAIVKGNGNFGAEASNIISIVEGEEEEPEILPAPTNVVAMTLSDTELVLMWDAVEGAEKYNVYNQNELVGTYEEVNTKIEGLTPGTEYCFKVTAVDVNGESEKSGEACAKTSGEKPENPEEGVEELQSSIHFYPNPVNDKLYIETLTQTQTLIVEIYDIYGRIQNLSNLATQQHSNSIDVTNLNGGVYFVKVVTENGETVKRIIKN